MLFGYHVSTAGGLHNAFKDAEELTCDVIQIFIGSPQVWQTPQVSDKEIEKFKTAWKNSRVKQVLVHSAYLPNPASHKMTLRNFSLKKLKEEAKIAYRIGADGYNFHCGSNQNSNQEGVKLAIKTLNRLAELTDEKWPVRLIIENDAGAGNRIGDTIEELGAIWKGIKNKKRFGFCLDTCHLFVSGTDLRTQKNISDLLRKFDRLIGLKHLKFIHMNDARRGCGLGSKKDRHANIGKGEIGAQAFKNWLHTAKLRKLPFILETPRTGNIKEDIKDIKLLRKLAK
ncbi:endonuclease [candidate division Kazan bacterium]|uniref:Probable endonuclease 4 n=1 Tax=candidate division Kazan bacterium TaxID=2202143 RepID=A0A420ZDM0_UNCK3|nr:MAG: endonuclease [candidate division Kazan bacterium]